MRTNPPRFVAPVLLALAISAPVVAGEGEGHDVPHHRNHVGLFAGYAVETERDGHREDAGAIGIEWERRLGSRWGVGVAVEELGSDTTRNGVAVVPVSFHAGARWRLFAGPGIEFTDKKNKLLMRVGAGYEIASGRRWSLTPEFLGDFIENGAITWLGGLVIGLGF